MTSIRSAGLLAGRGAEADRKAWRLHLPPNLDLDGVDLLAQGSLPGAWRRLWEAEPDREALVDIREGITLTRGRLDRMTADLARGLAAMGLRPGERVLLNTTTSRRLLLLYVACLRLGAVVVPANPAYSEREIRHIVADCDPALAVVDGDDRATWIRAASSRGRGVAIVAPDDSLPDGGACPHLDAQGPADLAMICYTSGTTGVPKGAMLLHGNLLSSAEALRLAWRWTPDDGLVLALPLFHIHGLGVGVNGSLLAGGKILFLPHFEPAAALNAAGRPDATLFFGVPTMYVRLISALEDNPAATCALQRLRLLVSGSAPLLASVWQRIQELTGQAVLERYGMTETIMNVSNPYDGERRPGSVGLPLPGVEVRIAENGVEASEGATGEILVRGPNVFPGYWKRDEATAEVLDADGWLRTGDMGWRSADGYLTIAGRARELIISGGFNVYPREVEEVLEEHPRVAEAAVVGLPSLEWGEEVAAYVVPARDVAPSEDDLKAWCRARLAPYKWPRQISFVAALPRNAMGKIVRARLLSDDGSR